MPNIKNHNTSSFLPDDTHPAVLLAPMAGVSDATFRTLCRELGADMAFTEMVSAKGLSYSREKTSRLLDLGRDEHTVGVQLFGHEPSVMASTAVWIEDYLGSDLAWIDINMGCPTRKIVSKGDGAALMKNMSLASELVRAVCAAVTHPVTVKIRRGWNESTMPAPEFARYLEDAGAAAITVHGRFATQLYRGKADWNTIASVKDAVDIPVVGNGDIRTGADACAMIKQTGCDHVMIARGAEGNPWIFAQVHAALAGEPEPAAPSATERIAMARRHADLLAQQCGRNIMRMRKHAMWYMHGLPGAAAARGAINTCTTLEDFSAVFDELQKKVDEHAA